MHARGSRCCSRIPQRSCRTSRLSWRPWQAPGGILMPRTRCSGASAGCWRATAQASRYDFPQENTNSRFRNRVVRLRLLSRMQCGGSSASCWLATAPASRCDLAPKDNARTQQPYVIMTPFFYWRQGRNAARPLPAAGATAPNSNRACHQSISVLKQLLFWRAFGAAAKFVHSNLCTAWIGVNKKVKGESQLNRMCHLAEAAAVVSPAGDQQRAGAGAERAAAAGRQRWRRCDCSSCKMRSCGVRR